MSALEQLRDAIVNKNKITLLNKDQEADQISTATALSIKNDTYDLDADTSFTADKKPLSLRAIYNAWLHKDSKTAEYISDSQAHNIATVNFSSKNDLISYLDGTNSKLGVQPLAATTDTNGSSEDENSQEPKLLYNNLFQGEKLIDFKYLVKDIQLKIINPLKSDVKKISKTSAKPALQKASRNDNPIILLSPSTSALLQMQNVKQFLETGVYTSPASLSVTASSSNLLIIKKTLAHLGAQKFLIVNSTEYFTKPEYWNRVVAIFTTGQPWQFKNYITKEPEHLFQRYKGYYLNYEGESVNKNVQNWNVEVIKIDRNRRFNDKEIAANFWASLEKSMIIKGYK